jgi:hypothetical protein
VIIEMLEVVTDITGLGPENDCTGEGQQQIVNDRSVLSSEREPHINKPATV